MLTFCIVSVLLLIIYIKMLNWTQEKSLFVTFNSSKVKINDTEYTSFVSDCHCNAVTRKARLFYTLTNINNVADSHRFKLVIDLPPIGRDTYTGDVYVYNLDADKVFIICNAHYLAWLNNDVISQIRKSLTVEV